MKSSEKIGVTESDKPSEGHVENKPNGEMNEFRWNPTENQNKNYT